MSSLFSYPSAPQSLGWKPKLLDLFCCAGGAAMGYHRAGFEVVGVDLKKQPNYPFQFIQADVMELDIEFLKTFDAIHASPPCHFPENFDQKSAFVEVARGGN
jgi:23S rRNA G2069 N7-methylase RlmK/C1962 C5-methylase RlmI